MDPKLKLFLLSLNFNFLAGSHQLYLMYFENISTMKPIFFSFCKAVLFIFFAVPVFSQIGVLPDDALRNHPHWFDLMQKENPNFFEVKRAYDLYFENHQKVRGSGYKIFERWAWKNRGDFDEQGFLNPARLFEAYHREKHRSDNRGPSTNAGNWMEMGPMVYPVNVSGQETGTGRVNAIAFHPSDENVFWVGAPSGGLWQTDDGGDTYFSTTDQLPTLGVSSIIVHPVQPDTIYIGTGDRDAGDAPGLGVFRSVDGGLTWAQHNNGMGNRTVGCMIMHPTNRRILLAATSNGIYKTVDSGNNWTLESGNNHHYKDLVYHPTDPNYVYATAQGAFYRSVDGGDTWTQISAGLVACDRIVLDVSAAQPNSVFCLLTGGSQKFQGIFKSTDQGLNFTRITPSNHPNILGYSDGDNNSQHNYDLCILVNPSNANQILVGSICIHRSDDGGVSFQKKANWSNQVHADQHVVERNPLNNRIYEGHDGGLHYSNDYFNTWTNISGGLRIAQTYRIGQAAYKRNLVINGYQDNGTSIVKDDIFYTVAGGDGMESAFDYNDENYVYTTYISEIKRSHTKGIGGWSVIAKKDFNGIDEEGAWVTPYSLHVTDPNTMYLGYKNLWRTNNVKSSPPTWTKISNNLGGSNSYNLVYTDQSPADADVFYAVKDNNQLFRTDNVNAASPDWIDLSSFLPVGNANIDDIVCHPTDKETVYLLQAEKIYRSGNKGQTWTNITGSIPTSNNLNTLAIDKFGDESLYVGTKTGVYHKNGSLADWIAFDGDLPIVDVREMEFYYGGTGSRLRIGTYGRGLWETDLYYDEDQAPVANFVASKTTAFTGDDIVFEDLSANGPTSWTWTITPATFTYINSTDANSQHPEIEFSASGVYTVSLTATNANGSNVKTINSYIQVYNVVAPSCTPSTVNLGNYGMGIYNVQLNTINFSSGDAEDDNPIPPKGYLNLISNQNTILAPNTQYSLTAQIGASPSSYKQFWNVYIDYNNDGDFSDANELIYNSPSSVAGMVTATFTTLTNPSFNLLLRLRIVSDYYSISGPCDNPDYGQAEDYGIIFKDLPTLTTTPATNITYSSASSGGNITQQGSSAVIARGLVWNIRSGATLENNWGYSQNGSGTGTFIASLSGLSANTAYYVRAYAINGEGISYGNEQTFITSDQAPVVVTADVSPVLYLSAVSGGNVTDDKGRQVTARGVVWDTSGQPSLSRNAGKTENGTGTGAFTSHLTGLTPATTYYVRAYARNGYSVSYGEEKTFTTLSPDPNQSGNLIFSNVTTNKMTISWTNGTGESRIVKINNVNNFTLPVNGTDPAPNTVYGGNEQVIYNGTGNSVTVTNLSPSTTYYFHVFDYNGHGAGTVYNIAAGNNNPASKSTYCLPTYSNGDVGTHIKQFTLNKINNSSGASHYTDYTNLSTALLQGETYTVSVLMSYNGLKINLWIDFNDNGVFEAGEKLISELNCPANQTTSTSINIPANANPGTHLLRVRAAFNSNAGPCDNSGWGETEDYSVEIKDFYTWDGASSNNWNTGSNWDVGKVPGTGDVAEIENVANKPVIQVGQTVYVRKVTCLNGSEIEVNGTLNVEE